MTEPMNCRHATSNDVRRAPPHQGKDAGYPVSSGVKSVGLMAAVAVPVRACMNAESSQVVTSLSFDLQMSTSEAFA